MSLFSPTPVLSIVVPYTGDDASFEASLVSVLENRPRLCEVLVCHDGSYTDPFALGDEVRFVTSPGRDLPTLVAAAAESASGRLLHVLADGFRATAGWTDAVIDCFADESVGSISPLTRTADGKRSATIGWTQNAASLCASVGSGKTIPDRRVRSAVKGSFLNGSFWRTEIVRAVARLPHGGDATVAAVAWTCSANRAGFRCHSETLSAILEGEARHFQHLSATASGRLQAVAQCYQDAGLSSAVVSLFANVLRPAAWGGSVKRIVAALGGSDFAKKLQIEEAFVAERLREEANAVESPAILRMPSRGAAMPASRRRAA